MTELIQARIDVIDPSPFRDLSHYPFIEKKIATLRRSIEDCGLWEGAIARRKGNRFELAFAHHRIEAARRNGLETVPLLIRNLDDDEMLRFAAYENSEDFNCDFLAQLELWEAAIKWSAVALHSTQPTEIARLLGWTRPRKDRDSANMLGETAKACNSAHQLIEAGHMTRADLTDLSIKAAREIVERAHSRIEMLEKLGTQGKRPRVEIQADQKHVAHAAKSVARDVRGGGIRHSEIRGEIDYRAHRTVREDNRQTPIFAAFAKSVADHIHAMLVTDRTAEKLAEMERALPIVSMEEDHQALRRIDFALAEHEHTTGRWRERLTPQGKKVVPFKLLKKGGE
jgi:hypothetical protein